MNNQKESMRIYRKFKIEDTLAKNMFFGSNMNFCMSDMTSGVNKFV
jgi:hypothetical protein